MPNTLLPLFNEFKNQSIKKQEEDIKFFATNPPNKEIELGEETIGIFDLDGSGDIFYAQKYSNGYHLSSLIRLEASLLDAIFEIKKNG
jgi:hypothetical protein